MKGSSEQSGLGNMNEIKRDIDDVVNDLKEKNSIKKQKVNKKEYYQECLIVNYQ